MDKFAHTYIVNHRPSNNTIISVLQKHDSVDLEKMQANNIIEFPMCFPRELREKSEESHRFNKALMEISLPDRTSDHM